MATTSTAVLLLSIFIYVSAELLGCQNGSCYHFLRNMTWNDSRVECVSLGGDLAMIPDEETHSFVAAALLDSNLSAEDVWIGAKAVSMDAWYWDDGTSLAFSRWSTTFPEDDNYVAEYNASQYHWRDELSAYPYRYICDALCADPVPVEYVRIRAEARCLLAYVGGSPRSWYQSRTACAELGTILATVDTEAVFNAIRDELSKSGNQYEAYWIGLHREDWAWVDGAPLNYIKWDENSPDGKDTCLSMYHVCGPCGRYFWKDDDCNIARAFVCEVPDLTTIEPATVTGSTSLPVSLTMSSFGTNETSLPMGTTLGSGIGTDVSMTYSATDAVMTGTTSRDANTETSVSTTQFTGTYSTPTMDAVTGTSSTSSDSDAGTGTSGTESTTDFTVSNASSQDTSSQTSVTTRQYTGTVPTGLTQTSSPPSTQTQGTGSTLVDSTQTLGTGTPHTQSMLSTPAVVTHTPVTNPSLTSTAQSPSVNTLDPTEDPATRYPDESTDVTAEDDVTLIGSSPTEDNVTAIPVIATGLSAGEIAGITIGCAAGAALILFIIFLCCKLRNVSEPDNSYSVFNSDASLERYADEGRENKDQDYSFVNPVFDVDQKSIASESVISPNNNTIDFNPIYATSVKTVMNTNCNSYFGVNSKFQTPGSDAPAADVSQEQVIIEADDDIQSLPPTDAVQNFDADDDDYDDTMTSPNRTIVSVTSASLSDQPIIESLEDESVFVTTIVLPPLTSYI